MLRIELTRRDELKPDKKGEAAAAKEAAEALWGAPPKAATATAAYCNKRGVMRSLGRERRARWNERVRGTGKRDIKTWYDDMA